MEDRGMEAPEWWSRNTEVSTRMCIGGPSYPCFGVRTPVPRTSGAFTGRSDSMIIFDWDDTLLPTSFFKEMPVASPDFVGQPLHSLPFYQSLMEHADLVQQILRAASAIAHISIVTLSARPWVLMSSETYLPGLDMEALMQELDIPVFYATEHLDFLDVSKNPDACLATISKRNAMTDNLRRNCASNALSGPRLSVLSIGDSLVEQQALKDCCLGWGGLKPIVQRPFCKTVKLIDKPSLQTLSGELRYLLSGLQSMASRDDDFDARFDACSSSGRISLQGA